MTEFEQEVEDRLVCLLCVKRGTRIVRGTHTEKIHLETGTVKIEEPYERETTSLYMVYLEPYAMPHSNFGELPPGQVIETGPDGYYVYNTYLQDLASGVPWSGPHPELWAARPLYKTADEALQKGLKWLRENRQDLVRMFEEETHEAIRYRTHQAFKKAS